MFSLDPKLEAKIKPHVKRVLVLESNQAYARILTDMLRVLGTEKTIVETDDRRAMMICEDMDPQLIFCDLRAQNLEGAKFVTAVRRSEMKCRKIPIIMMASNDLPETLKEARDCGADEIMKKPFASGDLLKRLEHAVTKSPPWIEAVMYVGPDRRRFNSGAGPRKRAPDNMSDGMKRIEQSVRILRAAADQFDVDRKQANRAIVAQLEVLVPACKAISDPGFKGAVTEIFMAYKGGTLSGDSLRGPVATLAKLFRIDDPPKSEAVA
ncbi:response regulator [Asticcacaulis endophyticus]|uniref:Response regulator n=1 Tax=Asticcacaulis endophyticus TaxID=1395890 RepID=A0A918PWQ4_9CAUL|nr:response regulator [Asticcacaulis endophyticus]GGZ25582.1 response regulator [Asticcacaulis endophyticus]